MKAWKAAAKEYRASFKQVYAAYQDLGQLSLGDEGLLVQRDAAVARAKKAEAAAVDLVRLYAGVEGPSYEALRAQVEQLKDAMALVLNVWSCSPGCNAGDDVEHCVCWRADLRRALAYAAKEQG